MVASVRMYSLASSVPPSVWSVRYIFPRMVSAGLFLLCGILFLCKVRVLVVVDTFVMMPPKGGTVNSVGWLLSLGVYAPVDGFNSQKPSMLLLLMLFSPIVKG